MIKRICHIALFGFLFLFFGKMNAQYSISGIVKEVQSNKALAKVTVVLDPAGSVFETSEDGKFRFDDLSPGKYNLSFRSEQFESFIRPVEIINSDVTLEIGIKELVYSSDVVIITDEKDNVEWMRQVDGFSIYSCKKNELIYIESLTANLATNNARQVYNRVPGLNIWESDAGGLQLGIGGRGLSPARTSNFNTRQNGYDISADALGYPESYYTPPTEAVHRIEVVRGASSLQYGTQFGGMLNFVLKDGPKDRKIELLSRQTGGSYGLFSSFNSIGGQVKNINYYAFYQGKRGDGWRENSKFHQHTAHASVFYQPFSRLKIGTEYTMMRYLAQQPGGLTDAMFYQDPKQSIRDRNWFRVNWNVFALTGEVELSSNTKLNIRNFGLLASREALGYLGSINRVDPGTERDLIYGSFKNFGNETRILHKYNFLKNPSAFLAGVRYYQGYTETKQGYANSGNGPDFTFINPADPEHSSYTFPSRNVAFFAENLFNITPKLSVTPGIRVEYIRTSSKGSYKERAVDLAGNIIFEQTLHDSKNLERAFAIGGIGAGYKLNEINELYANISQNYRAINFNDLRVVNPNFRIDENLHDERGYNADLGFRGKINKWLDIDFSLFYLSYKDRIGQILLADTNTFEYYRYRTNIADSRNVGVECYSEIDVMKLIKANKSLNEIRIFSNFALIDARYVDSDEPAFDGNLVELVPRLSAKAGLNYKRKNFSASWQWSCTGTQFTDATNAETSPNAVEGRIPAYNIMDLSLKYGWKRYSFEGGITNLMNSHYFTQRAVSYPGPGIIPSPGRQFYLTLQVRI